MNYSTRILIPIFFLVFTSFSALALPIYWIGGSGDWDDPSHWSKDSGGDPVDFIPDPSLEVIFDNNSGLNTNSVVTLPPGSYSVSNFTVQTSANFEILFSGTSSFNPVEMNIYGDLSLPSTVTITYSSLNISHNIWKFQGDNSHEIDPGGNDLNSVEFLHEQGAYIQVDDLIATGRIRMFGGTWNTSSFNVNSGELLFKDNNSSNNQLTKVFNANNSTITCEQFDSHLTYGSLTVTGNYSIYAGSFVGSPKQGNGPPFILDKIYLTGYTFPGGGSLIEKNHFECRECLVNSLIIESSGETQIADRFTVVNLFEIKEVGSTIKFNGGNLRLSEVTIEGQFITPSISDCEERTVLTNVYNDYSTFVRTSGILHAFDAVINNIQASGGGSFKYSNGVLLGSSAGWALSNSPNSKQFRWIGTGTIANWDDLSNWELENGDPADCLPTHVDDVLVDDGAISGIRIPFYYDALCRNFNWTNKDGLELKLDGTAGSRADLQVGGNFFIDQSAIVTGVLNHAILFSSIQTNQITTNTVVLPKIEFVGALGQWELTDKLECSEIKFWSGTLNTNNKDVETNLWRSLDSNPKVYIFGSSHIKVNGLFNLGVYETDDVTVHPGTSMIECEDLISREIALYDVQFNNMSSIILDPISYDFHHLYLNGAGSVTTVRDLSLDKLTFLADNSTLNIGAAYELNIEESIHSDASLGAPATLKSSQSGVQVNLNHPFNLCASGHLAFEDINGNFMHVLNAPDGIDNGNNSNITFSFPFSSDSLHWIGRKGEWADMSNWSRLSGGCPDTKNPDYSFYLVFDDHSFLINQDTVFVPEGHSCGNLIFRNPESVSMVITDHLDPNNLTVDNASISLIGKNMTVANSTEIDNGGFLSTKLLAFESETFDMNSGLTVIRQNSNAFVNDVLENSGGYLVIEQNAFMSAPFIENISGTLSVSGLLKSTYSFYQGATITVTSTGLIDATGIFSNYSTITGNYLITGILENYGSVTVKASDSFQVRQ